MPTTILGMEHTKLLDDLWAILIKEPSPINQQIAIELLTIRHAGRAPIGQAKFVADSMHKHVRQVMSQLEIE